MHLLTAQCWHAGIIASKFLAAVWNIPFHATGLGIRTLLLVEGF